VKGGLDISLAVLTSTENEAAVDVLIPALDAPQPAIHEAALRALLERRSVTGQRDIIRRLHAINDRWKELIVNEGRGRMAQALRDAALEPDSQVCANACQAMLWFREYDLIPTLINAAEDEANTNRDLAATTLLSLAEQLYEELSSPRDYQTRRDPQLVRKNVTGSLEDSVRRFSKHKRTEIIEAFLLLAGRDNATLMQILCDPLHATYVALIQMLMHSNRPGVMRLILSYLDSPQAPTALVNVMAHRTDRKFVENLLRKVGHTPSAGARVNLKHVESIPWLRGDNSLLDELDDAAQHSVVELVMASRIKSAEAYAIVSYLALEGKVGGRRAAAAALDKFAGAEANNLALQVLKDPDPQVQASILAQLRQRGIPGALPILLGFVDSAHHLVRQAARDSLGEFGFQRFLAAYDLLDEEVRRSTGLLVKRIDVNTLPLLRQELTAASGKRRLRGISIARTVAAVPQLESILIELLGDEDHLIRAAAVAALGDSDSPEARAALENSCHDRSMAVQEAATASLERIKQRARQPQPPVVSAGLEVQP
jgi:HEAT repeat protein